MLKFLIRPTVRPDTGLEDLFVIHLLKSKNRYTEEQLDFTNFLEILLLRHMLFPYIAKSFEYKDVLSWWEKKTFGVTWSQGLLTTSTKDGRVLPVDTT